MADANDPANGLDAMKWGREQALLLRLGLSSQANLNLLCRQLIRQSGTCECDKCSRGPSNTAIRPSTAAPDSMTSPAHATIRRLDINWSSLIINIVLYSISAVIPDLHAICRTNTACLFISGLFGLYPKHIFTYVHIYRHADVWKKGDHSAYNIIYI